MQKQISYCPFCGVAFDPPSESTDPRSPSGYRCENCREVLELQVNQFPVA